jgi:hypothetical protein
MAGLLEMLERLDPEQLRRLAQEAGAYTQQKPEIPSWIPSEDQMTRNLEKLREHMTQPSTPVYDPSIKIPTYDITGLGYDKMPDGPVPVYDIEGFRYMYPDWMKSKGY